MRTISFASAARMRALAGRGFGLANQTLKRGADGDERIANLVRELSRHLPHGGEAFLLHKMVGISLARLAQHEQEANQLVRVIGEKQRLDAHRGPVIHRGDAPR